MRGVRAVHRVHTRSRGHKLQRGEGTRELGGPHTATAGRGGGPGRARGTGRRADLTDRLAELRATAREYGVYAPQATEEHGGMGYSLRESLPAFEIQAARRFRIVDGADEVHRRSIAREAFADPDTDELAGLTRYGDPKRE